MTEEENRKKIDDIANAYRTLFLDFPMVEAQLWLGLTGEKESVDVAWTGYDAFARVASTLTDENMEMYKQWIGQRVVPEQGNECSPRELPSVYGEDAYHNPEIVPGLAHEQRQANTENIENIDDVDCTPFPTEQFFLWWREPQEIVAWYVAISEQIANRALALQRQATVFASGTPWEPALDFQQHLTSQWLSEVSAFVRACWGLPVDEEEERWS